MAIATQLERRAVAGIPFLPVSLIPDGRIAGYDRPIIGWSWWRVAMPSDSGTEFSVLKNRPQCRLSDNKPHATLPKNRPHFRANRED